MDLEDVDPRDVVEAAMAIAREAASQKTVDEMVEHWQNEGALESDEVRDVLMTIHEVFSDHNIDTENPDTYRSLLIGMGIMSYMTPMEWLVQNGFDTTAIDMVILGACRGVRDLKNRG